MKPEVTEIPDEIRAMIRAAVRSTLPDRPDGDLLLERSVALQERCWLAKINSTTPLNYGTFPDPRQSSRRWECFSTAISEGWLMLSCRRTGAEGVIKDPTREEWSWAFDCPSNPKPWWDNKRVTLMREGDRYED